MDILKTRFEKECLVPSDINEHLHHLAKYSEFCNSIVSIGGNASTTLAFAYGLLKHAFEEKKLILNFATLKDVNEVLHLTKDLTILKIEFQWKNNLEADFESCDILFIDSWHVYGQLKRELDAYAPKVKNYIIMHDTVVDELYGESIRERMNIALQSEKTGIPENEIRCGLQKAIFEFLENYQTTWMIEARYKNNHGLVILKRIDN